MNLKFNIYVVLLIGLVTYGCGSSSNHKVFATYKGVYTSGAALKSFKDCDSGNEYMADDRTGQLEQKYKQMDADSTYMPVYVEVEAEKIKSGKEGKGAGFDSTVVIRKVIKITKNIPQDMCN
jgi:uncharacterized protein (UPF0335 family)